MRAPEVVMELFSIDAGLCTGCGRCALACPLHLVVPQGKGQAPAPRKGKEESCIACGHCASACPSGAFSLAALPRERFRPLRKALRLTPRQAEQFLASRRSVRAYSARELSQEALAKVLDIAAYAPSGHHAQPVRWVLTRTRAATRTAAGLTADWMRDLVEQQAPLAAALHLDGVVRAWERGKDLILRGAPHLLCAVVRLPGVTPREDAVIATAYAELAAHGLGLGACWAGYLCAAAANHAPLRDYLGVGPDEALYGALMLGRPRFRYAAIPPRKAPQAHFIG
jgi:nitroreductase/ferredoxin